MKTEKNAMVISIFEMINHPGYLVPEIDLQYHERDTGLTWFIKCGGTRAYLARAGKMSRLAPDEQAAESHFMIGGIQSALVMSSAGLFVPQLKGRVHLMGADSLDWATEFDLSPFYADEVKRIYEGFDLKKFEGWYAALSKHIFLRRAVADLVIAMRTPTEAFVFIYRGFEWLEDGLKLKISKKEMAVALGVEHSHYKALGKMANVETGVRHASSTGSKIRADTETYSTWMCGLVDGLNSARSKIEKGFVRMAPKEVAEAMTVAVLLDPYP
jgi:hypothetical protein